MTNLKQFLKPDWRKIVIFLVLLCILLFLNLSFLSLYLAGTLSVHTICAYKLSVCARNVTAMTVNESRELLIDCSNAYSKMIAGIKNYKKSLDNAFFFISPGVGFYFPDLLFHKERAIYISLYWYLLSCLIVWIYDKFRKK